jgi:hypothetical protein
MSIKKERKKERMRKEGRKEETASFRLNERWVLYFPHKT